MASALDENSVQMSCDSNECETVPNITEQHLQNGYEPLFEVEEDEDCGRFLVAKQKINQGQVILFEKPTVHGPSRDSGVICFGCYNDVDEEDPKSCDKCGLPLCNNEGCQESEQHQAECKTLCSLLPNGEGRKISMELLNDIPLLNEVVLILRCLGLRDNNVSGWLNFTSLQSHVDMREETELGERADNVAKFILQRFGDLGVNRDMILQICGILDVNSFEVPHPSENCSGTVQAVYADAGCLAEHNCVPTAHRNFTKDLSLCLRAAGALDLNDHISITYTDSLWTTAERRSHLMGTKYFECVCLRCCDPKEMNSYISALKCLKCTVGYFLPTDTLEDTCEWCCEDCGAKVPNEYSVKVNEQVTETIQLMEYNDGGMTPETCEDFLRGHLRVLHPQHAHMLDVKHSLIHLLGHHEGYLMADLSDKQLQIKEDNARSLLSIADKLLPGISRLKGTTLYELYLTYQQRGMNWNSWTLGGVGRIGKMAELEEKRDKDVSSAFKTAENFLSQCIESLKYEPFHCAEGKLVERAREEHEQLLEYIASL